jgi:UDP-N-acetylmuramoyl-tripeptide--D-alanyl-D-alanine ligase
LRFDRLAAITGGRLCNPAHSSRMFTGVSIDSRSIHTGELFFAVRGQKHDGHDFIAQAVKSGAGGIVVEYTYTNLDTVSGNVPVVTVHSSHEAMMTLAKKYRETSRARFAAVTGSNGKTTTKELAVRLLRAVEEHVYGSPGNLNNLYGAPLALFAMPAETKVAIMEMGISTPGEMTRLAQIIQPALVLITNVGPSHLEFLHTVQEVAQAKLELVKVVSQDEPVILNADDAVLMAEAKKIRNKFTTFAIDAKADFRPDKFETTDNGTTQVSIEGHTFQLPLVGKHQVYNLVAAYALFRTLGFSFERVDTSRIPLGTAPWRGQIVRRGSVTFLADCYNANPDSVKAGLKAYFDTPGGKRRVVILGDMLELGKSAEEYHREVGRLLAGHVFDLAVFVGDLSRHAMKEAVASGVPKGNVRHYRDAHECSHAMKRFLSDGDFVYVKGSRGVGLEAVLDAFEQKEAGN